MISFAWRCAAIAACAGAAGYYAAPVALAVGDKRIALTALKFAFSTQEIRVTRGKPVTLELTASDFIHGFAVPDFNVRADLVPGKVVEVTFTPDRSGRFVFLCDNFCGDGHDRMTGTLVVTDE